MIKALRFVLPVVGLVLIGWGGNPSGLSAAPPVIVTATVGAVPSSYSGYCPKTIVFKGTITASAACTVQYKFIRSDGATKPVQSLAFIAAGSKTVDDSWSLGDTFSGWEAIQIISPTHSTSAQASFALTCLPKPNITGAMQKHFGSPTPELDIMGTNFGAAQGTKNVQIDGHLITAMPGWSMEWWHDTVVSLQTGGIIPWEHVYQIAIVDGGSVISNVYSARFHYKADGTNPVSGMPGSTFTAYFWELPAVPGGLVMKMGSATCTIVHWGGNDVQAKVPSLPAGTYEVYLQKGADIVSYKNTFKVLPLMVVPKK